jgi:nitrogen regulatory protein P-II 1
MKNDKRWRGNMKEIKAFIQPFLLGKVTKALEEIPEFPGMSVSDVKGFGRGKMERKVRIVEFVPKVKIEIIAKDEMADRIVETIQRYAHTGNMGDGKIFVSNIERAVRIRSGEKDEEAIWSPLKDE